MAMTTVLLQATNLGCHDGTSGWSCFLDAVVAAFGGHATLVGLFFGSMAILSLYVASGYHPAPPSVGTMIIGGLLIPWLPVQYHAIAQVVMLLGFITGIFFILKRYSLEVGR